MGADDGRLKFVTYVDNKELKVTATESKRILQSIGDTAEQEGGRIDSSFRSALSGVRVMAKEATALFARIAEDFDVSTPEAKINALKEIIKSNEAVITSLNQKFDEFGIKAKQAFAEGNFAEFDNLTAKMEETATKLSALRAETDNYTVILQSMQAAQGGAAASIDDANKQAEKSSSILVKLLGGQEKYNAIVTQLPKPLQAACSGIVKMTGAAKAFIATPLGAILAAIILALQALKTWFNSTAEGQMAFAKISGYLSGVLTQLKEVVIKVGEALYKAFADPKKAIKDLWEFIKENIVNRFKALGDITLALGKIIKSAFTFDWDAAKEGARELADGFLMLGTGIEDVTGKVGDWAKAVNESAKASANIAVARKQLEIEASRWEIERERLEQIKADARMRLYDTSLSRNEREKALNEYKGALNRQLNMERDFAKRRIALHKESMALRSVTLEDEMKLHELEAELEKIEAKAKWELSTLQRSANRITNPKFQQQLADELQGLIDSTTQAEIEAMADGAEKKIAQIRLNYAKEIAEIKQLEANWRKEQEGELSEAQQTAIEQAVKAIDKKRDTGILLVRQEDLEDALKKIETYEQQRTAIQEEFNKKRKRLFVEGDESKGLREGVVQENLDELLRAEEEALNAVDEQFASREEAFLAWSNQIAKMTLDQLVEVMERAEEELKLLEESGDAEGTKLAVARAKVEKSKQALRKAKAEDELAPGKRTQKEWEDLYKVLNEISGTFNEIGDEIGGMAGDTIKTAGQISTSVITIVNGIVQLATTSTTAISTTASTAAAALAYVESASVVLTVIAAAIQVATAIIKQFGGSKERQERVEKLTRAIEKLQWQYSNPDILRIQEEQGRMIKQTAEAYSLYAAEVKTFMSSIENQAKVVLGITKKSKVESEALTKQADSLAKGFTNVGYSISKALGGAKFDEAENSLKNIAKQQILLYEQIELKKKDKNPDWDAISEYERKIEELGRNAITLIDTLVEDIIGGSAADIANELGDALFEVFQRGGDYAEAWGDKVNDIVADILKRMLISQFLEEPLGEIFDKYKARWFKEGRFVGLQEVIDSMSGFAADLNVVGGEFATIWENLPDSVKSMFTTVTEAREASTKEGIATASQESIDETNGRLTAMQGHTYSINENTKLLVSNTYAILQSVVNIEGHTARLTDRVQNVEVNVKAMKDTLNDFAIHGIKVR